MPGVETMALTVVASVDQVIGSCTYWCVKHLSAARVCNDTLDIVEDDVQQAKQSAKQMTRCSKIAV